MSEEKTTSFTTTTPRKRQLKRTQPQQWQEHPSSQDLWAALERLQQAVDSLQKRLSSLESEWEEVLEHLSQHADSDQCDTEEEGLN